MKYLNPTRRLGAYSAMAASFLALQNESDAQIVYTNLIPDKSLISTGVLDTLHLDLDGDALTDFIFNASFSYSSYGSASNFDHIGITGVLGDRIAFSFESSNIYTFSSALFLNVFGNFAKQITVGAPIGPSLNFINYAELYNIDCYPALFSSVGDYCWTEGLPLNNIKYIGFRLKSGPLKYYGWMRLSVNNIPAIYPVATSVTIYDYAINYTAFAPINAGQGFVSCVPIDALGTGTTTAHWAKVYWEPEPDIEYYEIEYRVLGGVWESRIIPGDKSNTKLNGLSCSTNYEWQIRGACVDGTLSEYSESQFFETTACRTAEDGIDNNDDVSMYANGNNIYVNFDEPLTEVSHLYITNMLGQMVMDIEITNQDNVVPLNVPTGMYTVNLVTPNGSIGKVIAITQ